MKKNSLYACVRDVRVSEGEGGLQEALETEWSLVAILYGFICMCKFRCTTQNRIQKATIDDV